MSLFQPVPTLSKKEAQASIEAKLAAFQNHKRDLLNKLLNGCKSSSKPLDEGKSWRDICQFARFYFWVEIGKPVTMSGAERCARLSQLAAALRRARGLIDRAMKDEVGDCLYDAFCTEEGKLDSAAPTGKDGFSARTRPIEEIKEMATALARLETLARAAAANDKPNKGGRPTLLPRECIQGLARVYRKSTGAKPGRGAGPFAEFAYEFMTAVGQTGFEYESLTDAIQDAHRLLKPSWFDEKT